MKGMTGKLLRNLEYQDRMIEKIDTKKIEVSIARGTKRYGKIIRNGNGTIRKVMVA